ncbi:hypothetical protein [Solobacterium moorei]|uniref:hypothetical protein n=1 Tax=Solobacterium moorei TaxID=102148 RepID=UPI00041DBBFA|nr:hypothetical protein [Solobacterium moorei]
MTLNPTKAARSAATYPERFEVSVLSLELKWLLGFLALMLCWFLLYKPYNYQQVLKKLKC